MLKLLKMKLIVIHLHYLLIINLNVIILKDLARKNMNNLKIKKLSIMKKETKNF